MLRTRARTPLAAPYPRQPTPCSMSPLKTTLALFAAALPLWLSAATRIELLSQPSLWQRTDFAITGTPAANNPFDPDEIALDADITTPSGKHQRVPAFWCQAYSSALVSGTEQLTPLGQPGWQLRYVPTEVGDYSIALQLSLHGQEDKASASTLHFQVKPRELPAQHGWVRVAADKRSFETSDGHALRLIGENVCWPHEGGTRDYEAWFEAMAASGQNFARLWMAPWWGGIEHKPGTLTRYDMDAAWRMDRVFELAAQHALYVMLCLDHHGMYQVANKNWGGSNNFWATSNPYSVEQGGPCAKPNDFFASPEARKVYAKRLRYLVARYGASPALHSWQFFNEIDNVWRFLKEDDVLSWHREMAARLRSLDPYGHLITTSLTGSSDRPSLWSMPEMDFAIYHSYAESSLAAGLAARTADATHRYDKPYLIGEFGVSAAAWHLDQDPYLRGFRQALWGGALGGSTGTAMSWWWEDIHADRAYPLYKALHDILYAGGWNEGTWTPIEPRSRGERPAEVGEAAPDGAPFNASFALQGSRSSHLPNCLAVNDELAAARGAEFLSAYLHGSRFPDLRTPHRLSANLAAKAKLQLRVKQVAGSASLVIKVDGQERLREDLGQPAGENPGYQPIGKDYAVDLPAGRHLVELSNEGQDWIILEKLQLDAVLPSALDSRNPGTKSVQADTVGETRTTTTGVPASTPLAAPGPLSSGSATPWTFAPEYFGLRQDGTALLYVVSPQVVYPANATRYNPAPCAETRIQISNMPAGAYEARFMDPSTAADIGAATATSDGKSLDLPLPEFSEDLAIVLTRHP